MTASITLVCDRKIDRHSLCGSRFFPQQVCDSVAEVRKLAMAARWSVSRSGDDFCPHHS